jgi:hypothetical protein
MKRERQQRANEGGQPDGQREVEGVTEGGLADASK